MSAVRSVQVQRVDAVEHVEQVFSVSTRVFSTPDSASPMIFWRAVAFGFCTSDLRCGIKSPLTKPKKSPSLPASSALRLAPFGAAQSRQRAWREGVKAAPTASAFVLARLLLVVEDAQEQDPGQFRHILHRAGAFRAAEHVANRPDGRVRRAPERVAEPAQVPAL